MIEAILFLIVVLVQEYSSLLSKFWEPWKNFHKNVVLKCIERGERKPYYVLSIFFSYRIYILSQYTNFVDGQCMFVYMTNILGIIVDILWFYGQFYPMVNNDVVICFYTTNLFEVFIQSQNLHNKNSFVSWLCRCTLHTFFYEIIALLIWSIIYLTCKTKMKQGKTNFYLSLKKICYKDINRQNATNNATNGTDNNNICQICFQEYSEDIADCYLISCGHYAHSDCFEEWWKSCRQQKCYFSFCKPKIKN